MNRRVLQAAVIFLALVLPIPFVMGNLAKGMSAITPTPTASSRKFDFPGIDSILPGTSISSAKQSLELLGLSIQGGDSHVSQEFGVLLQRRRSSTNNQMAASDIRANLTVQSEIIQESFITLDGMWGGTLSDTDWKLVDPQPIVQEYGTPTFVRANVTSNSGGVVGGILIVWESRQAAVLFDFSLEESDLSNGQVSLCLNPNRVYSVLIWLNMPEFDVKESIGKISSGSALIFGQPFSPTMFTNAPDLATFAQRLANGECLETPGAVWFK